MRRRPDELPLLPFLPDNEIRPAPEAVPPDPLGRLARDLRRRFPGAVAASGAALPVLRTGVAPLDDLLQGGLPLGRLSILAGPPSSGRTGLALAAAAAASARGAGLAWIDLPGAFHPPSAAAAGIELSRLVVVQPAPAAGGRSVAAAALTDGILAATLLLQQRTARLVVLDLSSLSAPELARASSAAVTRLGRAIAADAACLALAGAVPAGNPLAQAASVIVSLSRARCAWQGPEDGPAADEHRSAAPASLAGLSTQAVLVRSRLGGEGRRALVSLVRRSTP